jgi:L-rhamnose mutarotase
MSRRILILDLKDDPALIAAYEAHHLPGAVPEAIVRSIRASGIEEMEIYRCGNRLVMVMETAAGFDPEAKAAADASDPAVIAWEELMDRYQQRLSWAPTGTKWMEGERIFALSDQPGIRHGTSPASNDTN